jgi:hypothetical protein
MWPGLVDNGWRDELTDQLLGLLRAADKLEMHDVLVFDRMLSAKNLFDSLRSELVSNYVPLALDAIVTDPGEWDGYGLKPLSVVDSPNHILADELKDVIELNLDYILSKQESDGSWQPSWSWYGRYPEAWPEAERDIRSKVTANAICILTNFGRF